MPEWEQNWLVGSGGVHYSADGIHWKQLGPYTHAVRAVLPQNDTLFIATDGGLWAAGPDSDLWRQVHDETLTEVMALAPAANELGLIAASPYGVSWPRAGDHDTFRWTSCTEDLPPDQRFTNALLADPQQEGRWLAGTEAGLLVLEEQGQQQQWTNVKDTPVRALCYHQDRYWAGTDRRGLWYSDDGHAWQAAGPWEYGAVLALAPAQDALLAGTEAGVICGQCDGPWAQYGPALMVTAVAADRHQPDVWLAGAGPGGLWRSADAGATWLQTGSFQHVNVLLQP